MAMFDFGAHGVTVTGVELRELITPDGMKLGFSFSIAFNSDYMGAIVPGQVCFFVKRPEDVGPLHACLSKSARGYPIDGCDHRGDPCPNCDCGQPSGPESCDKCRPRALRDGEGRPPGWAS